jgi:hypothetical protein
MSGLPVSYDTDVTPEQARKIDELVRPEFEGGEWVTVESEQPTNWSRELVKEIAMDIGKELVAYIEVQYPDAIKAASSTFKLSMRNKVYNEIMAAIAVNDTGQVVARLKDRKKFRRWWVAQYRKIRRGSDQL